MMFIARSRRAVYSKPFVVSFGKQYLPLPYFSGFLRLACQSIASDRNKQFEQDFQECHFLTTLP